MICLPKATFPSSHYCTTPTFSNFFSTRQFEHYPRPEWASLDRAAEILSATEQMDSSSSHDRLSVTLPYWNLSNAICHVKTNVDSTIAYWLHQTHTWQRFINDFLVLVSRQLLLVTAISFHIVLSNCTSNIIRGRNEHEVTIPFRKLYTQTLFYSATYPFYRLRTANPLALTASRTYRP